MSLLLGRLTAVAGLLRRRGVAGRYASTRGSGRRDGDDPGKPVRKAVFISQSTDVFANLALQHWLQRNYDFADRQVLLIWRNEPCVVLGRHQNPWKECNVGTVVRRGLPLARRTSDGGAVYYDGGDLNLSFFTSRGTHDQRYNREIVTRALFREWQLRSTTDERGDVVAEGGYKVHGVAAELGESNAYHHCALSNAAFKPDLRDLAPEKNENGVNTSATTTTTTSPIKSLVDADPNVEMVKLATAIGKEYMRTNLLLEDGGNQLFQQQIGFQLVNPTEGWFSGLNKLIAQFRSWGWNFGKTPKFTVSRTLKVPHNDKVYELNLRLKVRNGIVEEVRMILSDELASADFDQEASIVTNLCGTRYIHERTDDVIIAPIDDWETDAIQMEQRAM